MAIENISPITSEHVTSTDTITIDTPGGGGIAVGDTLQVVLTFTDTGDEHEFLSSMIPQDFVEVSASTNTGGFPSVVVAQHVVVADDLATADWTFVADSTLDDIFGVMHLLRAVDVALVELPADESADPVGDYLGVGDAEAPRDLYVDPVTKDLVTSRDLHVVSGTAAVGQAIQIKLNTLLGEWFLDEEIGFPYFTQVLVKAPNLVAIRELYRQHIAAVPGVLNVLQVDVLFDPNARSLSVSFSVDTDLGEFSGSFTSNNVGN